MIPQINGLHHVTALASSARANNAFHTGTLGLRRVKKTVNFDAPDVYHLYYGDGIGTPGTVMTYFPFPDAARGKPGTGEVSLTAFMVPSGSLAAWSVRLSEHGVANVEREIVFGAPRLVFDGPDGERLALVEADDGRDAWLDGGVPADQAIRGFHSVTLRLADETPTAELLRIMGYDEMARDGANVRFALPAGNGAGIIDIEVRPDMPSGRQGAGSVHHVAFSVPSRAVQSEVRQELTGAGFRITPPIDRDYFWAIYFRSPGGVLFEIATDEPGFERDEDRAHLGQALKLPSQHAHLRQQLEQILEPLD